MTESIELEAERARAAPLVSEATPDPSEGILRSFVWVAALLGWALLVASVLGILIAGVVALVGQARRLARFARVRGGGGVRVDQARAFDPLASRLDVLCKAIGIAREPELYVTRWVSASSGIEAERCFGELQLRVSPEFAEEWLAGAAWCEFCVAHELARLHTDHALLWGVLTLGRFVPCLGSAYTRACVYTRDRLAAAATELTARELAELMPQLSVGPQLASRVAARELFARARGLDSVARLVGSWLSPEPSLLERWRRLDPSVAESLALEPSARTRWIAAGSLTAVFGVSALVVIGLAFRLSLGGRAGATGPVAAMTSPVPWDPSAQVRDSLVSLAAAAEAYRSEQGTPPPSDEVLYQVWQLQHPGDVVPVDPYDEQPFGYSVEGDRYVIWSAGPNLEDESDDISYFSPEAPGGVGELTTLPAAP